MNDYTIVESENEASKTIDKFRVIFPDGTTNNSNAGRQDTIQKFKKLIHNLEDSGTSIKIMTYKNSKSHT